MWGNKGGAVKIGDDILHVCFGRGGLARIMQIAKGMPGYEKELSPILDPADMGENER